MGEVAERLLQEALALPTRERLRLAQEIADTVDEVGANWEHAWRLELDRRLAEMKSGAEEEIPLDEVRLRLRSIASR